MKQWWNNTDRAQPKYLKENLSQCKYVYHKTPHKTALEWNQGLGGERPVVKLQILNNRNIWSRYNRKYSPEKKTMKSLSTVLKISDVTFFNTNDEHWESECHVNQEVKTLEPGLSKRRDPGQKQCCRMSKGEGKNSCCSSQG